MVFSSIPVYLDPNSNWQQHQNLQLESSNIGSGEILQLPQLHLPSSQTTHAEVGGVGSSSTIDTGSIRPGSMADRARLAKLPQPEQALKCPRCESNNTKFCYYNNYNLCQPRYFCKACRRYWTRGGALRNVPVGGGCRRNNKKNKSKNRSKSPTTSSTQTRVAQNSEGQIGHLQQPQDHDSSFIASIQNLTRFGGSGNMGLNLSEIGQPKYESHDHMSFPIGGNNNNMNFRQQFPFFGSFDSSTNLYPFNQTSEGIEAQGQMAGLSLSSARVSQMSQVTMEGNQGLNLSRSNNLEGNSGNNNNNNQFWGRSAWTDLSGLNSSSSTNHLL